MDPPQDPVTAEYEKRGEQVVVPNNNEEAIDNPLSNALLGKFSEGLAQAEAI